MGTHTKTTQACMSIDVVWHAFAQSFFTLEIHDLLTGPLTYKAMILLYRVAWEIG